MLDKIKGVNKVFLFVLVLLIIVILVLLLFVNKRESFENTQPLLINQPNPLASQFYYALDGHKLSTGPWSMTANTTDANSNGVEFASKLGNSSYTAYGPTHDVYWRSDKGKVVLQDKAGNVGVGTANPTEKLSVAGDLGIWGGKIQFRDSTGDNSTDPYSIEKICTSKNNCSLRVSINDDINESLQIYGGACSAGKCSGPGVLKHNFVADGSAQHIGSLSSSSLTTGDINSSGNIKTTKQLCIGNTCLSESELNNIKNNLLKVNGQTGYKIATGSSSNWSQYNSAGITQEFKFADVGVKFTQPPKIFTSLSGPTWHWTFTGMTSIYEHSAEGFRVYISNNNAGTGDFFNFIRTRGSPYTLNWVAIGV